MVWILSCLLFGIAYGWTEEKGLSVSDGVFSFDIGEAEFNANFWASAGVIKRDCPSCGAAHQTIYYKRLTDLKTFPAYNYFRVSWLSSNNILGDDFELYSSLEDLEAGTNAWTYCNYDDVNIGPFRDCGPTGYVAFEWTSNGRGGDTADYYILTDCADEDCDDGDICNGGEFCLDGECTSGEDLTCPADFVCSSSRQRCVRDCETFAIDGYLRDCSEEFDYAKNDIVGVINQASDNLESIDALQPVVTANSEGLALVGDNVDEINAAIGGDRANWATLEPILDQLAALNARVADIDALLSRMDAVEARLDTIEERLFGFAPQGSEGENSANSFTSPDESASTPPLMTINGYEVHWMGAFVALTAILLAVNAVLFLQNCCCSRLRKDPYRVVYADSSDDQVESGRLKQ